MTATAVTEALNALLFGEVWLLGFLIMSLLLLMLVLIKKEAAVVSFPLAIILSLMYLENNIGWGALLMLIETILLLFLVVKDKT